MIPNKTVFPPAIRGARQRQRERGSSLSLSRRIIVKAGVPDERGREVSATQRKLPTHYYNEASPWRPLEKHTWGCAERESAPVLSLFSLFSFFLSLSLLAPFLPVFPPSVFQTVLSLFLLLLLSLFPSFRSTTARPEYLHVCELKRRMRQPTGYHG